MKKTFIVALVLMGCFLTGCAKEIPLDNSNNEVVAEYVADLLLRYGSDDAKKLVYTEPTKSATEPPEVEATPKATPTTEVKPIVTKKPDKPSASPIASDNPNINTNLTANTTPVSLSDIYGVKDVSISIKSSKEYVSYPENASAYCITAQQGYKLYIVTLSAKNNSNKKTDFQLGKKGITYYLYLNNKWYSSLSTILENDAQYLDVNLASGKSTDFLVAFEIEEKSNTKDTNLVLLQDKNSCELRLN